MNRYLKLYSKKYFLTRILECSEEELAQAKGEKGIVCIEDRIPKKGGFRSIVSVKPGSSLATEKFLRDLVHRLHFQIWFSAALTREFANIAEVIIKKWIGGFFIPDMRMTCCFHRQEHWNLIFAKIRILRG